MSPYEAKRRTVKIKKASIVYLAGYELISIVTHIDLDDLHSSSERSWQRMSGGR